MVAPAFLPAEQGRQECLPHLGSVSFSPENSGADR